MGKRSKRVLFIHIEFYEYSQRIKDKMKELGYIVDCFCEDPKIRMVDKILQKFNSQFLTIKSTGLQNKLIKKLSKSEIKYDYIFVIKGEKLQKEFLLHLKELNPKAQFVLYMWDDAERVANFLENKDVYDKIYSFDKNDSKQYGLELLPLFFCDHFRNDGNVEKNIDAFFLGWDHSDRRQLIEKILPILRENNMNYYFHLYTGIWKSLRRRIWNLNFRKKPDYVKYNTLSLKKSIQLTLNSRILIDIQHPSQSGLTMRTLETLAAKSKLITTNSSVEKYDFYNPKNILIIDRENPVIDPEFLKTPYENVPEEIVEEYSLANWIQTMLDK